jgi:alginate O-acetyltransferase complex protein AlgI
LGARPVLQFQTLTFLFLFLPFTLIGYYALRSTRYANLFLLAASLYFYAADAIWFLWPLFVTALLDYYLGMRIHETDDQKRRLRLLILSVVVNLALLSVFKYTTWLTTEMGPYLAGMGIAMAPIVIPLPAGISFYTFQSMSYTIDVYKKEFRPYRNVIDYMSFVSFFPHLVAGPIMRARDLLPQLATHRPLPSAALVSGGLFMILFGLFQKMALADNFGWLVEYTHRTILSARDNPTPGLGLVFAYAFAFQIYCDFAAYSTIARGCARLLNVDLMRNFQTPYFSTNPSEFWQRWHISLSTWLRDYLYIPLGGSRFGNLMTARNLLITMFLGGLWHGAGIFFILWGLYHGALLVLYRVVPIDTTLQRWFGKFGTVLSMIIFFHFVCFGWILFRTTPNDFVPIMKSITSLPKAIWDTLQPYGTYYQMVWDGKLSLRSVFFGTLSGLEGKNWYLAVFSWGLLLFTIPVLITDYIAYRRDCEFPDLYDRMPDLVKAVVMLLLLYGIVFFGRREANEFIYFAF